MHICLSTKMSSQQSNIHKSTFGNSFGDFISDKNTLNNNDKTGIHNSMVNFILSSKSVDKGSGDKNKTVEN